MTQSALSAAVADEGPREELSPPQTALVDSVHSRGRFVPSWVVACRAEFGSSAQAGLRTERRQ
jgi:hypothetical protein